MRNTYSNILSFLFCFIVLHVHPGNKYRDSLFNLTQQGSDTQKVNTYNKIERYYLDQDYNKDSALHYIQLALSLSEKTNDRNAILKSKLNYGYYLMSTSDNNTAARYFKQLIAEFKKNDAEGFKSRACNNLGICYNYRGAFDSANFYYDLAIHKTRSRPDPDIRFLVLIYSNKMNNYLDKGDLDKALSAANRGLQLSTQFNIQDQLTTLYNGFGIIYKELGEYPLSLENYYKSLAMAEQANDIYGMAIAKFNIASVYSLMKKFSNAEQIFFESKAIFDKKTETINSYGCLIGIAGLYIETHRYDEALEMLSKAEKEITSSNNYQAVLRYIYLNMASAYEGMKKNAEAEKYYILAIELSKQEGAAAYCDALLTTASFYQQTKQYSKANELLEISKKYPNELKNSQQSIMFHSVSSEYHASKNNFKDAFFHLKSYVDTKDSLDELKNSPAIDSIRLSYIDQKHQTEVKLLEKEKEIQRANLKKEKNYRILFSLIGTLVLIITVVLFRSNIQRKKANLLLSEQKEELAHQKLLVDEKNKDITDSIQYAHRIQKALLISDKYLEHVLHEHFVFYMPRDIVSGDFYWAYKDITDGKVYLTVADCTGHGVPGAFMSMLGMAYLNEIVMEKKVTKPNEVLSSLRHEIITSLNQQESEVESKDGMDMAFICIDTKNKTVEYSGANNPLIIVSDGKLKEFKADKFPVGKHTGDLAPFTLHRADLKAGDMLYMFSDGFADQFGGPQGKKYKTTRLKELLLNISAKSHSEQKLLIEEEFISWKGSTAQLDDVLVFGVRI